jgi:nitroreductase
VTSIDIVRADELLTTTRSVRKRLDLTRDVPQQLILDCIDIALQAPTGSNRQGWSFIVVTDKEIRAELARLYKEALLIYASMPGAPQYAPTDPRAQAAPRVVDSAWFLAENLQNVPVHVIPCVEGRVEEAGVVAQASTYGSILPAAWSFMLAARARGLGSAWTTLHLMYEKETAELLNIPDSITQTALLPVAYYTGETFKPASRLPATDVTFSNQWGNPV